MIFNSVAYLRSNIEFPLIVSLHISGDIVSMNQTYLLICCEVFCHCGLLPVVCLKGVGLLSHTFLFIETGLNYRIQM